MFELPPLLQGDEQNQLYDLRNYLVRLALSLEPAIQQATELTAAASPTASVQAAAQKQEAQELKSLIVKTANVIEHEMDVLSQSFSETYLAISDFGTYRENIAATFTQTARGVVESYDFQGQLNALDAAGQATRGAVDTLQGEIRRGLIVDPSTGDTVLGIAIAEKLSFTGSTVTRDGQTYYELAPGQTFGLYTATGWQFWIGGSKRGWFNAVDGMLHVLSLAVENTLLLGGGWVVTMTDGLGIKRMA